MSKHTPGPWAAFTSLWFLLSLSAIASPPPCPDRVGLEAERAIIVAEREAIAVAPEYGYAEVDRDIELLARLQRIDEILGRTDDDKEGK